MTPTKYLRDWRSQISAGDTVYVLIDGQVTEATAKGGSVNAIQLEDKDGNTFEANISDLYPKDFIRSEDGDHKIEPPKTIIHVAKQLVSHPIEVTDKTGHWYEKPLLVMFVGFLAAAIVINFVIGNPPKPSFATKFDEAHYYDDHQLFGIAESIYEDLLTADSLNLDLHHDYILCHFAREAKEGDTIEGLRTTYAIDSIYAVMTADQDSLSRSVAWYGLGLSFGEQDSSDLALAAFDSVPLRAIKYLNNSIGVVYRTRDSLGLAESYYRKEIALNGYRSQAYRNLFKVLGEEHKYDEAYGLLKDTAAQRYCPASVASTTYFAAGTIPEYLSFLYRHYTHAVNGYGFLGALLILFAWLVFLRRIDVFESEPWKYVIATLVLGMVSTYLVFPFTDWVVAKWNWTEDGTLLNDWLYYVGRVGLAEELVKLIPVLIILRFAKAISEPVDYLIYGSISALGFAFVENLLYFSYDNLSIITGRALNSVVLHMFLTSTITYAFVVSRGKSKWTIARYVFGGYILAAVIHGTFDWVLTETTGLWSLLGTLILMLGVIQYALYFRNALNLSPYYDQEKVYKAHLLKLYLCYALAAITLFEYFVVGFADGATEANRALLASLMVGGVLIFWLSNRLGDLTLSREEHLEGFGSVLRGRISDPIKEGLQALGHVLVLGVVGFFAIGSILAKSPYTLILALRIGYAMYKKRKDTTDATVETVEAT